MTIERPALALAAIIFILSASGQGLRPSTVRAEVVDSSGAPVRFAFLQLRPQKQDEVGLRVAASAAGIVSLPAVQPGRYELTVEAGGFNTLSETIDIEGDKDLGHVVMDADPTVLHVSAGSLIDPDEDSSPAHPTDLGVITVQASMPLMFRGRIEPSYLASGGRSAVQLACFEQRPGMPLQPKGDKSRISVNDAGVFETAVPICTGDKLAYRELRFSLQDEGSLTTAILIPKMEPHGYYQSRTGISLPLKPLVDQIPVHEATFFPEFTDNRALQARVSIGPWKDHFVAGETVYLSGTLTNTSDEVLAVPSTYVFSDVSWRISDDSGKEVPSREQPENGGAAPRVDLLFPGQSETFMVNVSFLFSFSSAGTYHVVARPLVRRPDFPGAEQTTSAESTFVITEK
jgi:hypothetical protein